MFDPLPHLSLVSNTLFTRYTGLVLGPRGSALLFILSAQVPFFFFFIVIVALLRPPRGLVPLALTRRLCMRITTQPFFFF